MNIPEEQYALYAEFGFTAEKAQLLETEAGNLALSYLALFVDSKKIGPEETEMYQGIMNDLNQKTFGALLKHIKAHVTLDDQIQGIMNEALDRRNYLTHHFFRTHNFALFSEEGRKSMIQELKAIQDKLDLALRTLEAMTSGMNKLAGREDMSENMLLQMQTRGKKVNI